MFRRTVKIVFFIFLFIEFSVSGFAETKKEYYSDNKLKTEWELKNGKLDGISKTYYRSGKLQSEWFFNNDELQTIKDYNQKSKD